MNEEELMLEIADLRLQIGAYKAQLHGLQADLAGEVQRREIAESLLPDEDVFSWIDDQVQSELDLSKYEENGPARDLCDVAEWCDEYRAYLNPNTEKKDDADSSG